MKHPQAMEVISDSFGNYVAQRLVQRADVAERMDISNALLKPAMLELSGHQYGCRVIQAAIEVCHACLSGCVPRAALNTAQSAHVLLLGPAMLQVFGQEHSCRTTLAAIQTL